MRDVCLDVNDVLLELAAHFAAIVYQPHGCIFMEILRRDQTGVQHRFGCVSEKFISLNCTPMPAPITWTPCHVVSCLVQTTPVTSLLVPAACQSSSGGDKTQHKDA